MRRSNLCGMKCTGVAAVLVMVLATAACDGSSDEPERAPAVATAGSASPSGAETTPVDESTMEYVPEPGTIRTFPRGYPKVVAVSSLPGVVRSWYETDYDEAIAVAPGVWTPKAYGVTKANALDGGVLDGYCGSVRAYERKFVDGAQMGGTCW
jgi:hypothetical protein